MIRVEGYTLGPRLLADPHHEVYAARRDADGLPVLIKVGTQPPSTALPAQLRREYELLRRIDARGVVRPLALVETPPALVLQASDGVPLGRYAAEHPPSMTEFLTIAVQLAEAVAAVHEARIVHKDIQPGNILIAADRLAVQLVDFGRAAEIGQLQRDPPTGPLRDVMLLYLAPEQTGGVDAAIDFRSDLYSLGATLYELLTGSPPFEGEPAELIRSHLSRVPVPPHERAVDVPEAISRIVCKLLEKAPEARYQSARGLRGDLLACSDQLTARGAIDPHLALGVRDTPGRLAFPRKLYGRERELQQLRDAFVRTAKGRTELCLLSGPPGVGKSRTANELRSAVAQASGHFAAGRFDRFRSDVPCAGFVEAFGSLIDQILTESDARLSTWKTEISAGLGNLARVLVDLVPGLRLIVENPPPLPRVGSKETTQRLALAICRFIQTVARSDSPLVLFLDDLQWADSASRYLLEEILCTEPTRALLIIGAYQEREVDASHPLLHLLARLEREDVAVQTLQLEPLTSEQCSELIAETLGERVERVLPLAELVRRKTGNVPLHVQQFLLHLQELGLLSTDASSRWTWDQDAIAASDIPDDVVAMLEAKLARLEQGARELLKIASCVGASFEGDTLAELAGRDRESVGREALRLVEEGLLVPCREGFRFVHERLREVAQALGSDAERERLHHRVAQLLLSRTPEESLDDHIFEIADHLQRASSLIGDDERVRAIELQLRAGARALSRGGFEAARGYLQVGRRLARETDWERAAATMYALHLHAAEAAALLGEYAEADAILDALEKRPLDVFERARVQGHRVAMYSVTRPPIEAVRVALAGLRERGIRWSERPSRAYVRWVLLRTRWKLRGRTPEQLARPDASPSPEVQATLTLIFEMAAAAYRYDTNLGALVTASACALAIDHGAAGGSPSFAIGGFGQAYAVTTGDYDYAAHVARLATRLRELGDDGPQAYKALVSTDLLVNGWCRHRRKALEALRLVRTQALEAGDVSFSVYAWNQRAMILLLVGEPLAAVEREYRESADFGRRAGYREWGTAARCSHFVRALTGREEELGAEVGLPESSIGVSVVALLAAMRAYHLGRLDEAQQQVELAEAHLARAGSNLPQVSEICFYGGLVAATLASSALGRARREHVRQLKKCARRLRHWARIGPDNFEHQALLLEAELARLAGDSEEALYRYALASEAATTQGYRQHAAIVNERRALLSLELGGRREPWRFIRAAIAAYDEWGARAISDRLRQEHSELLLAYAAPEETPPAAPRSGTTVHSVATTTVTSSTALKDTRTLDLTTVLRSSEAISGEVRLEHVLERVMSIAIENAGAQTALLLLEQNGELRIEARGAVGTSAARLSESLATSESGNLLPVNLVQYVQRTRKTVVLRDAASEGLFVEDPYITRNHVKSILCLPIIRQTKLVGVLYLENNLVTDAFTENRVEVLALLSSHAAISLDNARLYGELVELNRDLERRVEERTLELRDARDAAEAATRAKSEFLAVMSHEIRTPMNVVIGMAQLLKEMSLSTEQLDCIQAVHTAGDSLLTIINDILDFSKIEAGKLELEDVGFSVRDCVEDVAEILGPRAHDKGLDFPVHVPSDVPDRLSGDPGRLKQVLLNFVSNAIKFTEKGEIGVRVSHSIDAAADGQPTPEGEQIRLRFEIKDTGIGIPASRLDRLFRSFSQVDASTTRRYGGTGLGLAIAKRLAEAMGGRVGVESEEAVGSTFWFEAVLRPERTDAPRPTSTLSAIRALVLVEHAASAEALCEQLRTLGAQAQAAASGEELLALAEKLGPGPVAVLARYPFENPNWRAALASLRERAGVSLFLLSILQDRVDAEREASGWAGLITWPVRRAALRDVLGPLVGATKDAGPRRGPVLTDEQRTARARYRLLLAEDYELNQKLAVRLLERVGYRCDVVENGAQALAALETEAYDLVLMDCQMPEMDGFEATRRIRAREGERGGHVPIVAMTANAMKGDRERCLAVGMDDYLSKPIHVEALYEVLEKYLP